MIFYTLKGHSSKLEIYQDKIRLIKKSWAFFTRQNQTDFPINELAKFEIAVPKFLFFRGKIVWETFSGQTGDFYFTTHPIMVKKIETYLQKRVIKNHQNLLQQKKEPEVVPFKKKKHKRHSVAA